MKGISNMTKVQEIVLAAGMILGFIALSYIVKQICKKYLKGCK